MKYYKKGEMIANYQVDETWEEVNEEVIQTPFGLKTLSQTLEEEYLKKLEIHEKIQTIQALENWFENYFDKQLKQSLWQADFKPSYDSILNRQYDTLDELKEQAQEIRETIKELRLEVKNGNI